MEPISSLQAEEARLRSKLANNPFFSSASNLFQFLRWMLISTLTGLVVGSVSTIFNFGLKFAVDFRHAHLWVVLFLPVAGLAIVFLYRFFTMKIMQAQTLLSTASIKKLIFRFA